ncbi:MAG: hypothetical protein LBF09_02950, partial [Odoribacteraceae bacterium]|nr:hypothetical protein [Odoribacteraceae bacterium]
MNMQTTHDVKNGLDFIQKVMAREIEGVSRLFEFLSRFKVASEKAASKLVYHINVIDELHANENAHSRILAKLLQQ